MAKIMRTYRMSQETLNKITEMQNASGKTATDLIEAALNYVSEEYIRATKGREHDAYMLAQVLSKRIEKVS